MKLAGALRKALLEEGVRKVDDFAQRHNVAELVWPAGGDAFLNVNTPADLSGAARRLIRGR